MNEFETSANEVEREACEEWSGKNCIENVVEWVKNMTVATFTFSQRRMITKMKKYAESHPDEVRIKAENDDGSIVGHIPTSWIHIRPPKRVLITEEERERRSQFMKKYNTQNDDRASNAGETECEEEEDG